MKARPILFSGQMVRALLEGRKTQTRRIVKDQPSNVDGGCFHRPDGRFIWTHLPVGIGCGVGDPFRCPYGQSGDLLYVREAWAVADEWLNDCETDPPSVIAYRADTSVQSFDPPHLYPKWPDHWGNFEALRWRPSIHMYRWASRLTLRIKAVRVERLNAISAQDAVAEGRSLEPFHPDGYFPETWDSINGTGAWRSNPWVWVVEFEVIKSNVDQVLKEAA